MLKIKEQVANILSASPQARNSDKELLIIYMQKFGMNLTPDQIATFKRMPSTETIRRVRQQLQEQGKYTASAVVEAERYEKYKEVKHGINYADADELIEQRLF